MNCLRTAIGMRKRLMRPRAWRAKSLPSLILTLLGLTRLQAFLPATRLPLTPCRASARTSCRSSSIRRLGRIFSHPAAPRQALSCMKMTSSEEEQKYPADVAKNGRAFPDKYDIRVLVATAATGALLGWSVARSLDLDLDLAGAVVGCLVSVGLLAQKGAVGKFTAILGEFALGAFEVIGLVVKSSPIPAKVVGTVSEELLEAVELTSGAVTKGYIDSLPPVEKRLQGEIEASKKMSQNLKDQLKKANAALSEAKEHLAQRAENRRVVDAAKATAAELADSKKALRKKDAEFSESLRLAGQEKEKLNNELEAARAETLRFREILDSKTDMDENVKALTEASETLEERIQDYENRLQTLTQENDAIRADYTAEIETMEAERTAMRTRVSGLEASLHGAESRLEQQRATLEKEIALMSDVLAQRTAEIELAARTTEEMKGAVERLEAESSAALEKAVAEATRQALEEERAKAAVEIEALKSKAAVEREGKVSVVAEFERRERELEQQVKELGQRLESQSSVVMSSPVGVEKGGGGRKRRGDSRPVPVRLPKETRYEEAGGIGDQQQADLVSVEVAQMEAADDPVVGAVAGASEEAEAGGTNGLPKSKSSLMKLTVKDLREQCKEAGMPITGRKADLVDRLLESVASA